MSRPDRDEVDAASPVAVVRRFFEALAERDPDAVAELVATDFVNEHLSELGSGCVGREEYRRRLPDFLAMFDALHYDVEAIAELDRAGEVVARYRLTATHEAMPVDIPGIMWFVVEDGEVTRRTDVWDSLTFLRQTGRAD